MHSEKSERPDLDEIATPEFRFGSGKTTALKDHSSPLMITSVAPNAFNDSPKTLASLVWPTSDRATRLCDQDSRRVASQSNFSPRVSVLWRKQPDTAPPRRPCLRRLARAI